jgi:prepilin signal peptidase PulO-like enzyme (type II secretory pathway)
MLAMFNPLKWEHEDRVRLLFAAAFGALLGFANGYSHGWFNLLWALIGAVVVSGAFYCLRVFRR